MRLRLCPDALLQVRDGAWLASNPRSRRHVELDADASAALSRYALGAEESDWGAALRSARGWRRTRFSNADGLMADPSGISPRPSEAVSGEALLKELLDAWIVQPEEGRSYDEFLRPATSILDQVHLGTFHQAVGRFQTVELRTKEKWRWWHDQKFEPDGKDLKPGLYRWVQGHFFDRYFSEEMLKGRRLLDFGCGNGYYSGRFARMGARVTGIDPSEELLTIARSNHPGIDWIRPADGSLVVQALEALPAGGFDAVYLSDVLLFFFYDPKTGAQNEEAVGRLLRSLRRLLAKDGTLYVMEPDAAFWLTPWYGDPGRPFTVVTEFRDRLYHVAPSIAHVTSALGAAGFGVTSILHPEAAPFESGMDLRAHGYASSFPLWDFYVCRPL